MNSTDPAKGAAVRAFFDGELMPMAERLKREGRAMFPASANAGAATYFTTRVKTTMSRDDFVVPGVESPAAFGAAMEARWKKSALPEMASLAPTMEKLAGLLRGEPEKDEDVSPNIYVMF